MRTLIAALGAIVALVAILLVPVTAMAQVDVTWVHSYPDTGASGCVEYIAQWSDTSYTSVPWDCPAGMTATRPGSTATANRSYPQIGPSGCTEYVAAWSDGVYSWVPVACPSGAAYAKPVDVAQSLLPPPPPAVAVVPPIAPPLTGGIEFVAVSGAAPGGRASVTVRAAAGASCSILYITPAGAVRAGPGLEQTMADANGIASWSWIIEINAVPGTGFVAVSCDRQSGRADVTIG